MRLTLRTLLAYLDDVLEPAQAKEIGQKIKESSIATDLVERIREVMRRRRLGAPDVNDASPQANPNTVAEYLDNLLTPDQVAQLERLCLESDLNLAEVASAHQILSLVYGEPIAVPTASRERMYALAPAVEKSDSIVKVPSSKTSIPTYDPPPSAAERVASLGGSGVIPKGAFSQEVAPTPTEQVADEERMTVPDEIRPTSWWKKAIPLVAVAVILGVWLGSMLSDLSLSSSVSRGTREKPSGGPTQKGESQTQLAQNQAASQPKPASAAADESALPASNQKSEDKVTEERDEKPAAVTSSVTSPEKPMADEPDSIQKTVPAADRTEVVEDAQSPPKLNESDESPSTSDTAGAVVAEKSSTTGADEKVVKPEMAEETDTDKPAESKPDGSQSEEREPEVASAAPTGSPEPSQESVTEGKRMATAAEYRSPEGIMLYQVNGGAGGWHVKPHHAAIRDGEKLAVPEPFDATLLLNASGHTLVLQNRTVLEWSGPKEKADAGFVLHRGQVALRPTEKEEPADRLSSDPVSLMSVTLTVGQDSWLIQVMTPETVSGVEVIPYEPQQFEEGVKGNQDTVLLSVAKGTVRFARSDGSTAEDRFRVIDGPMTFPLPTKYREGESGAVDTLMSELTGEKLPAGQRVQGGRMILGYEWLNDQRTPLAKNRNSRPFEKEFERTVDQPIAPLMLQVSKDRNALLSQLAVTTLGLVEDHDSLLQILEKNEHEEARRTAIQELRIWLAEDPGNGRLLRDGLNEHFPEESANAIYQLMWGYPLSAATDPSLSAQLVEWLGDSNNAVRELAFLQIKRLTNGRHNDYRPNSPEKVRQTGINTWKKYLERNHGALVSAQEPDASEVKPEASKPTEKPAP